MNLLNKLWKIHTSFKGRFLSGAVLILIVLTGIGFRPGYNSEIIQEQETLKHEVKVTLKLVQVYVTDKKGNPVIDLDKEDFELYDKGQKMRITDFERHILWKPESKDPATDKEKLFSRRSLNRKFILFFAVDETRIKIAPLSLKPRNAAIIPGRISTTTSG